MMMFHDFSGRRGFRPAKPDDEAPAPCAKDSKAEPPAKEEPTAQPDAQAPETQAAASGDATATAKP